MTELNKYYTPDISDLFVGYEFEFSREELNGDITWHKNEINKNNFKLIVEYLEKKEIRTSYLTVEDILAEGWIQDGESPNGMLYRFTKMKEHKNLLKTKNGWMLTYFKSDKWMAPLEFRKWYEADFGTYDDWSRWLDPTVIKCPSKNEFRKILKMLEI